ncbi:MAG: DUF357 domain-containing protein [Thermoplasmata archaeon]|nr:MAG: DUF357 domain-containing protein [Thermoplasmata archaeon]
MQKDVITKERLTDYLDKTKRALKKVKITPPDRSHAKKIAQDFLNMATSYHSDAKHFFEKGEYVDAFACVNYAHGWLDAGVRFGLFDVGSDDVLFTLAE